ncbi:hypothetical protein [Thalassobellus citreus]|uniref:hypothetical protein n=1 Tax=Thalassobellus citreus TaxID=3367752 RepID=UPI0037BCC7E0
MKFVNIIKIISLVSYSLIILTGQMIGIPFIVWLFWTSFEFGNSNQIFAFLGLIGLILMFTKYYKNRIFKAFIFVLMLVPIVRRLTEVPIENFNYLAFQIPLLIFIMTCLILTFKPNTK